MIEPKKVTLEASHWNFVLLVLNMANANQPNPLLGEIIVSIKTQSGEQGV